MSNQENTSTRVGTANAATKSANPYQSDVPTKEEVRGIYFVDYIRDDDGFIRWIRDPYVTTAGLFGYALYWDESKHSNIRVTPLEQLLEPINEQLQTESEFRHSAGPDADFEPWGQVSERMFGAMYAITKYKLEMWRQMATPNDQQELEAA